MVQPRVAKIRTKLSPWFKMYCYVKPQILNLPPSLLQIFHYKNNIKFIKKLWYLPQRLKGMSILLCISRCSNFLRQRNIDESKWNKFVNYFEASAFSNETTSSANIFRFSFYKRSRQGTTFILEIWFQNPTTKFVI